VGRPAIVFCVQARRKLVAYGAETDAPVGKVRGEPSPNEWFLGDASMAHFAIANNAAAG